MSAPVETQERDLPVEVPENAVPIRLPVMVVEGMDTADGRHIRPGALTVRHLPIPLYAMTRSTHGSEGDAATWHVGAITQATRRPGPEVQQLSTGQPFPEGTFVWEGTGWMYTDVPAAPQKSAYTLVKDGALRGNSVDLSAVEAEFEYDDDSQPGEPPRRIVMDAGAIAATTLVGQPAFPDAYVELDGTALALAEPTAVTAGGVPSWRSADTGDVCSPCLVDDVLAHDALADAADGDRLAALALGDDIDPPAPGASEHTGGMLALVPTAADIARLAVDGGDPPEELHLTLAYLGDDVTDWDADRVAAVQELALHVTDQRAEYAAAVRAAQERGEDPPPEVRDDWARPGQRGPVEGSVFSHAVFNPNGDNGHDPATVYLLDGTRDRDSIDMLHTDLVGRARDALGTVDFPEQHHPFVPHITAGYGLPVDRLTYTGPVTFDRLRVALGGQVTDYPLGGGAVVASAAPSLPPASWFEDPGLDGPTPVTVTPEGRVYGHLACWGTCHIGFQGRCVTPPRSRSNYAYFLVHSTRAVDADGNVVTVPVGYGTIGTGHADLRAGATAAAEHYDNSGTAAFELACGEDEHGIWVAGRLMPGLDEMTEHRARGTVFSGDWRTIRGGLELVASLGVNVPGFPVPRARVASGQPLAMVAAGAVVAQEGGPKDGPFGAAQVVQVSDEEFRAVVAWVNAQRLTQEQAEAIADALAATEENPADLQDALEEALADALLATDGGHPWLTGDAEAFARLHLPPYIKRIANHLKKKGMAQGRAIATAVNAADRMCKSGDLNFPGKQDVNPGSRAEACAAIAQWKKDRPGSTK